VRKPPHAGDPARTVRQEARVTLKPQSTIGHAYELHFAKRFSEACDAYRAFLLTEPEPDQTRIALQQLENLRAFDSEELPLGPASEFRLPRRRRQLDESAPSEHDAHDAARDRGGKQGDEGR
jgi:hypothetical protein